MEPWLLKAFKAKRRDPFTICVRSMMALQGPLSAMEGTNGNYEPMNGSRGRSRGTLGSGTFSEARVEPQICDVDVRSCPALEGMGEVISALSEIDELCTAMIKRFKTPDGPGSSQSAVSQCSTEKTGTMNSLLATGADPLTEKKREKFFPPVRTQDVIDLTSGDSCDTVTSRRPDQEALEDAGQVLSPPSAKLTTNGVIEISDDEEEGVTKKVISLSPHAVNAAPEATKDAHASPEVKADDNGDPSHLHTLFEVFRQQRDDLERGNYGYVAEIVELPILPREVEDGNNVKRRKVNTGDYVSPQVNHKYQPYLGIPGIPGIPEANEPVQMEPMPVFRPKRGRGRPRKEDSTRKDDPSDFGCRDLLEQWTGNGTQNQHVDVTPVNKNQVKEKKDVEEKEKKAVEEKENKREGREKTGKRKVDAEDLLEEEDDEEEEENGKTEVPDLTEQLKHLSKLNKEKIDYDPYVRRKYVEEKDELEDVFMEMKAMRASVWGPPDMTTESSGKDEGVCDHKNFDFEDGVGYYCEDCGTQGIDMPTPVSSQQNKSGCSHRNYEFTAEAGIYCPDCGKVFTDIQSYYVAIDMPKALRKQGQNLQDTADGSPRVQLNLEGSGNVEDFCGADFQLHPRFEEVMHPHQKKGFKFLTEHLLGGQQPNNDAMGCVLGHAPGTGKTCLVISFIQSFLSSFPNGKPLILAPKIMLQTWVNQFSEWQVQDVPIYRIGASTCGNFRGDGGVEDDEDDDDARLTPQTKNTWKEDRAITLREWQASRGVLLMSYKLFSNLVMNGLAENVLPESLDFQMSKVLLEATNLVILDEGHTARNDNAQITKSLRAMKTKRKVILSGTLFHNTFKELYTVLKHCRDDFMISYPPFGKRIAELAGLEKRSSGLTGPRTKDKDITQIELKVFTDEIGEKLERYVKGDPGFTVDVIEPVVERLKSLTKFVDRYPGGILKNLPGLYEYSVCLNLTTSQEETIDLIPKKGYHMSRQFQLLSGCIHPSLVRRLTDPSPEVEVGATSIVKDAHKGVKISFLLRLMTLCRSKEKLLVFCATLEPLKYVEELFCQFFEWQFGKEILRLDGTMPDWERQRVIAQFNSEDSSSQVLLASTKACKEGITLVGASRVVVLDCPDNPSVVRQAVSRAFRIGQKKKVYVYRLVSTNEEEKAIFKRSVNKERLSQVLSDPDSSIRDLGGFLQELDAAEVEDQILKMMITERVMAKNVNTVFRYNAIR